MVVNTCAAKKTTMPRMRRTGPMGNPPKAGGVEAMRRVEARRAIWRCRAFSRHPEVRAKRASQDGNAKRRAWNDKRVALLPLDRPRRLRRHVVHHPVHALDLVDDARRDAAEE